MTIQTTQASEATQAVASLAEAAVAASQEMQQGATVTMALNRYGGDMKAFHFGDAKTTVESPRRDFSLANSCVQVSAGQLVISAVTTEEH